MMRYIHTTIYFVNSIFCSVYIFLLFMEKCTLVNTIVHTNASITAPLLHFSIIRKVLIQNAEHNGIGV